MATTNTRYVDPDAAAGGNGTTNSLSGGNCAYTSLSAWESARQADLPSGDIIEKVICSSQSASHTADSSTCAIDGWTTDSTRYIEITVDSGSRHAGVFSSSKYRLTAQFYTTESNVRVDGLQVDKTSAAYAYLMYFKPIGGVCDYRVTNTIIRNPATTTVPGTLGFEGSPSASSAVRVNNVICVSGITSGRNVRHNSANYTGYFENMTVIGGGGTSVGIYNSAGTLYCKNVYSGNHQTDYSGTITYTTSGSSDSTSRTGVTASIACSTSSGAYFASLAAGSQDLSIGTSSALKDAGTDLVGDSGWLIDEIDIIGTVRSGTWDIGAFEYVESSPALAFPPLFAHRQNTLLRR